MISYENLLVSIGILQILINNRKILSAMIEMMSASDLFDEFVIILDKIDKIGIDNVKKELLKIGVNQEKSWEGLWLVFYWR